MNQPLTDEERKAKEARLLELRAELEARSRATASSAETNEPQQQDVSPVEGQNQVLGSDEYDEGSVCSSDREEDFLKGIEATVAVRMFAEPMGEPLGEVLETNPCDRRCIVGDFELLRLAKMGDLVSFGQFSALTAACPATFYDNHGRNALHYAADSGNVALITFLIDSNVPFVKDEKMMTPVDIATLNQHIDAVKFLAGKIPEAAELVKSYEEVLEQFSAQPPRFTLTKPAPPLEEHSRPRAFWKAERSNSVTTDGVITVSRLTDARYGSVVCALTALDIAQDSHGFNSWLPPAELATAAAVLPRAKVVCAERQLGSGNDGKEDICGMVMAVPLGGLIVVKGTGARFENAFLITQLALHPLLRGANRTSLLLEEMHEVLLSNRVTTVVFRSHLQLPVAAIGMLKWSRRSIVPSHVFKQPYAVEVFPDFFLYDEVLRADVITKNALPLSFQGSAVRGSRWSSVDRNNMGQLQRLLTFITSHAEKLFDVAYLPQSVDDLLVSIVVEGLAAFVHTSETDDEITDVVVLRLRLDGAEQVAAAVCVYAVYTSFEGPAKAEEVLALAHSLKAETVFIPNMFGFTDNDLSRAMFEELVRFREYLYICRGVLETATRPTGMSRVAVPCLFI